MGAGAEFFASKAGAKRRAGWPLPFIFALLAVALAFIAMPHAGRAQGIVRGAMGAVEGVFGLSEPHYWHHHCDGYHDGYGRFHCYRYS